MFTRELKINYKSLLIWTLSLSVIYMLIFSIYPSLMNEESALAIKSMMESMPKEILAAFNMDIIGIESAYGWFKTEGLVFVNLIGSIYAATLGSTILLKEENDKTIEFLYAKPIPRHKIVSAKIACGIINIFLFTMIIVVLNYISILFIQDSLDLKEYLMVSVSPMLTFYLIFFITLFISTFFKKTKKAMSLSIGFVFVEYFMQIIGGMGEKLEMVRKVSLFEFSSVRYITEHQALNMTYLGVGIVVILICIAATYFIYQKKEFI